MESQTIFILFWIVSWLFDPLHDAQKEPHAIVSSVVRLDHILVSYTEFYVFTDHRTMLYMLSHSSFNANIALHDVHKEHRWSIRLAEFKFVVEHVPGENNVWRIYWLDGSSEQPNFHARRVVDIKVPFLKEEKPELPSVEVIVALQKKYPPKAKWN